MMGPRPNHIVFVWMVQVHYTNDLKPLELQFDITATVRHFRIMIFAHLAVRVLHGCTFSILDLLFKSNCTL